MNYRTKHCCGDFWVAPSEYRNTILFGTDEGELLMDVEEAKMLLPLLQYFVDKGELP